MGAMTPMRLEVTLRSTYFDGVADPSRIISELVAKSGAGFAAPTHGAGTTGWNVVWRGEASGA